MRLRKAGFGAKYLRCPDASVKVTRWRKSLGTFGKLLKDGCWSRRQRPILELAIGSSSLPCEAGVGQGAGPDNSTQGLAVGSCSWQPPHFRNGRTARTDRDSDTR